MSSTGLFQVCGANKRIPPLTNHMKTTRNRGGGYYQAHTRAAMYIYSVHHFLMLLEYPYLYCCIYSVNYGNIRIIYYLYVSRVHYADGFIPNTVLTELERREDSLLFVINFLQLGVPPDLGTLLSFFVSTQAPLSVLPARFSCLKPAITKIRSDTMY